MNQTQTTFLTGGSGKVGRVLTEFLLSQGHRLVVTTHRQETTDELLSTFSQAADKGQLHCLPIDLMAENAVDKICAFLKDNDLHPTGLINNARSVDNFKPDANGLIERNKFVNEFVLNVVVPYELTMRIAQQSETLKTVVNVGSMYGVVAPNLALYEDPAHSPINYGVTKSASVHLTKELSVRLANQNVRVNSVSLGGIAGRVDDDFKKRYAALCPQGRMLTDDEVVGPIAFLLSDDASSVTGHNLVADGGWSTW